MRLVSVVVMSVLYGLFSQVGVASTYESELAFYIESADMDADASEVDQTAFGINFTKYLTPVNEDNYPLEEANFFARSRNVSAGVGILDTDFSGNSGDGYIFEIAYQHLEKESPIGFEVEYGISDSTIDGGTSVDITLSEFALNGFFYITDNTRLGIGYGMNSTDIDSNSSQAPTDIDVNSFVLQAKTVNRYDGKWVNVEGRLIYSNEDASGVDADSTTISVDGDYYFNTNTSLGLGVAATTGDNDADSKQFALSVVFHTDTGYALEAIVEKLDRDSGADNSVVRFSFVSRNF